MKRMIARWVIPTTAVAGFGPAAGYLTAMMRGPTGAPDATALSSVDPVRGCLLTLGAVALAAIPGFAGARLVGAKMGMLSAGIVLAWASWCTGTLDNLVRNLPSDMTPGSLLMRLAGEALLVTVVGMPLAWGILYLGAHRNDADNDAKPNSLKDPTTGVAMLTALIAAAVAIYLVAGVRDETLKGQSIAATAVGAAIGAALGRVGVQRAPALGLLLAMMLLAIAGPLIAALLGADAHKSQLAIQTGTILPLARPLPLDYLAGSFIGLPTGLSWVTSTSNRQAVSAAAVSR